MDNGKNREGEGAGLCLSEASQAELKVRQAAVWEGHVSERPKGVVPGRAYGRGTVALLCLITAFQRQENTCQVTEARKQTQTEWDRHCKSGESLRVESDC